eukprot:2141732-Amphidinium_carterae.1
MMPQSPNVAGSLCWARQDGSIHLLGIVLFTVCNRQAWMALRGTHFPLPPPMLMPSYARLFPRVDFPPFTSGSTNLEEAHQWYLSSRLLSRRLGGDAVSTPDQLVEWGQCHTVEEYYAYLALSAVHPVDAQPLLPDELLHLVSGLVCVSFDDLVKLWTARAADLMGLVMDFQSAELELHSKLHASVRPILR